MSTEKLQDAMNFLDDDLIEETGRLRNRKRTGMWVRWASMAACIAILVGIYAAGRHLLPSHNKPNDGGIHLEGQQGAPNSPSTTSPGDDVGMTPVPPQEEPTDNILESPNCPEEALPDEFKPSQSLIGTKVIVLIQGHTAKGYTAVITDSSSAYNGEKVEIVLRYNGIDDLDDPPEVGDVVQITVRNYESGSIRIIYTDAVTPLP